MTRGSTRARAFTVIGLMSGTSTDGIAAALVRLRPTACGYDHDLVASLTHAFPGTMRRDLLRCAEGRPAPIAVWSALGVALGEQLARAAVQVATRGRVPLERIDLIGSHGHTVFHGPPGSGLSRPPSTLQIGEAAVIAARTGVTTVADFRPADVAAGGQGAPLAPHVHRLLFAHPRLGRSIHNLGGISNLTYLPPGRAEKILAFDTGPANMVIDALVAGFSGGRLRYDRGGAMAARGAPRDDLLRELVRHPYFRRRPPKSTGREEFGAAYAADLGRRAARLRLSPEDTVATATALTAETIAAAYRRFVLPRGRLDAIHFAGGGAHNRTLLRMVGERLPGVEITTIDELGVSSDSMEAIVFAVLACETVRGRCGNVPAVTGASGPLVLGKIVPGTRVAWRRLLRRLRDDG